MGVGNRFTGHWAFPWGVEVVCTFAVLHTRPAFKRGKGGLGPWELEVGKHDQ